MLIFLLVTAAFTFIYIDVLTATVRFRYTDISHFIMPDVSKSFPVTDSMSPSGLSILIYHADLHKFW